MRHRKKSEKENRVFEVGIEKIVPGGYGLGFADGKTIFVALAAAGDHLLVRPRESKGKVVFAEILEILKPAPSRVAPPCPYFGVCGGCDFQQMNYPAQLAAKVAILHDCLARIGKINYEKEIEVVGSPQELNYRARAQWHLDTRAHRIGYFKRHSHSIVDVENCPILVPALQNKLADLRENINWEEFWAENVEIETAASGENVSVYSAEIIEPTRELVFEAAGERYFYDAAGFFQGNPFLIEKLIEAATANLSGRVALDLYCGVGLFSLPLARRFEKVLAVEANARAIDFARRNAEYARLANVEFFAESVGEYLQENNFREADCLLLDPPRAGVEKGTIDEILKIAPPELSYVSCDPATLARDLRLLIESYSIESVTTFDLFPQTHHLETVVRLRRI